MMLRGATKRVIYYGQVIYDASTKVKSRDRAGIKYNDKFDDSIAAANCRIITSGLLGLFCYSREK